MNRRQLLHAGTCAVALGLTAMPAFAGGLEHVDYSREAFEQAIESGEPFMLDFYAGW